ncbi:3'-5' exonuclease [Persephonella sp.]
MTFFKKFKLLRYRNNSYFEKYYKEIEKKPLEQLKFCSFDLETTGFDIKNDEIISIGGVIIENLKINLNRKFYRIIKPERELKKENILIHGITEADLKNAPKIIDILPEFIEFIKGCVLIGYFVKFDIDMISKYTQKFYGFPVLNPYIDLRDIYHINLQRSYVPVEKRKEKNLEELAKEYGIPVEKRHDAFYDSLISALIFLAMIKKNRNSVERGIEKLF